MSTHETRHPNAEQDALAEVIAGHLPTGDDSIADGLIWCSCGTPVRANFEGAGGYIAGLNQAMHIHVADAILAAGWTRTTDNQRNEPSTRSAPDHPLP